MSRKTQIISEIDPSTQAAFQKEILSHWHTIQKDRRFPCKRDFRPQNFPRYLPQMAMLNIDKSKDNYEERLTGDIVTEVFQLHEHSFVRGNGSGEKTQDPFFKPFVDKLKDAGKPICISGKTEDTQESASEFATLLLPFSTASDEDKLDVLLMVFDFTYKEKQN